MDKVWLWAVLRTHVEQLAPVLLPVALLIVDAIVKWTAGKKDFRDLGADVCLAGFSLYLGTFLIALQERTLAGTDDVLTGIILTLVIAFLWWLCVVLSYNRIPLRRNSGWQPIVALVIAGITTYWCMRFSWALVAFGT